MDFFSFALCNYSYHLFGQSVFRDYKMESGRGIIEDVTLVNDFNQPYTEAHIIFKTKDNMEHECRFTIGHYGDYEEGIEPELENMLQSDKELFMKKKVPVFYSPKDVNRCIVYLEDSQ